MVLVLGIADRVGDFAEIPDALGRWEVLAVAGFMYAMEFVADKIPYIDSTWDVISTAIRPTVGAVVGVLLAGDADSLSQAVRRRRGRRYGARSRTGEGRQPAGRELLPRAGHATSVASLAEDVAVLGVVWFSIEHPVAAAIIAASSSRWGWPSSTSSPG